MTDKAKLDREIRDALSRQLKVLEQEIWDDGTVVTWLASPFPYEPKPQVPSSLQRTAKPATVRVDQLVGSQRRVTQIGVDKYARGYGGDLPLVYRGASGRLYIADGHHRLASALVHGKRTARVRLVDIGAGY